MSLESYPNNKRGYFKSRVCFASSIVLAFVLASVFRSHGLFVYEIYCVQELLGGDHVTHFLMGATFMTAGLLVTLPDSIRRVVHVLFVVILLLCLEEFSQLVAPTREFSWIDLAVGSAGALVVILWHLIWVRVLKIKMAIK